MPANQPQGASVADAIDWALQPGSIAPEVQAQLAEHLPGPEGASVREMVWEVTKVRGHGSLRLLAMR